MDHASAVFSHSRNLMFSKFEIIFSQIGHLSRSIARHRQTGSAGPYTVRTTVSLTRIHFPVQIRVKFQSVCPVSSLWPSNHARKLSPCGKRFPDALPRKASRDDRPRLFRATCLPPAISVSVMHNSERCNYLFNPLSGTTTDRMSGLREFCRAFTQSGFFPEELYICCTSTGEHESLGTIVNKN